MVYVIRIPNHILFERDVEVLHFQKESFSFCYTAFNKSRNKIPFLLIISIAPMLGMSISFTTDKTEYQEKEQH